MLSAQDSDLLLAIQRAPDSGWAPVLRALCTMTFASRAMLYHPDQGWSQNGASVLSLPEIYLGLRPNRVYSGEELATRSVAMNDCHGSDCRALGFRAPFHDVWLVLERDKGNFRAADSALLSALIPHIDTALHQKRAKDQRSLEVAAAQASLRKMSLGYVHYPAQAAPRPDQIAQSLIERLGYMPPTPTRRDCAQIIALAPWLEMLWLPGPDGAGAAYLRATDSHLPMPETVSQVMGLTLAEARLVCQLGAGASLQDAARQLGWTYETARAYCKQVFTKTGTHSQSDLMRKLWAGVIALA